MRNNLRATLLLISAVYLLSNLYGCIACGLYVKFSPIGQLPTYVMSEKKVSDITVMSGIPPDSKKYTELGRIKVEDGWVLPLVNRYKTEKDITDLVKKKAAEHGADAVIKYNIIADNYGLKSEGVAIRYEN